MSAWQFGLLCVAVAIQLIACAGQLMVRDAADRLHLVSPVSVFATLAVAVAIALEPTSRTHLAKAVVTGVFVMASSPFVSRATARALRIRAEGRLEVDRDEIEEET